ncbi:MAG TPA: hypothetical protein VGN72_00270 [Tepidisphaeraceae bacterium]|jgi:hypothetical protein|nr:hypothetical protein [Tepidisphaeraceae bacterium]
MNQINPEPLCVMASEYMRHRNELTDEERRAILNAIKVMTIPGPALAIAPNAEAVNTFLEGWLGNWRHVEMPEKQAKSVTLAG